MDKQDRKDIEALKTGQDFLMLGQKELQKAVETIKTNDLPHINKRVEEAMTFAKQAAFRSSVNTWIFTAGFIMIAIMVGLLALK